jgi:hypothetical protein
MVTGSTDIAGDQILFLCFLFVKQKVNEYSPLHETPYLLKFTGFLVTVGKSWVGAAGAQRVRCVRCGTGSVGRHS